MRFLSPLPLLLASLLSGPACAQLYKWVDQNGITHYSDRKPDDPKEAGKAKAVSGTVSVFEQDPAVLQAVEAARVRASRPPEPAIEPQPATRPAIAPAAAQPLPPEDSCPQADCGGYYYPYAPGGRHFRRKPVPLAQAQLPPGATAGTVNSPGIIPGNTGTTGAGGAYGVSATPSGFVQREPMPGTPRPRQAHRNATEPQPAALR